MNTIDSIRDLLARSDRAVERALVVLYERQTAAEQAGRHTGEQNGVGFNKVDAGILTSFAEQVLGTGTFEKDGVTYGRRNPRRLTPKQLAVARRALYKYAGQLLGACREGRPAPRVVSTEGPELFEDEVALPPLVIDDTTYFNTLPPADDFRAYGDALAGRNSRGEKWGRGYVAPRREPAAGGSVRLPSSTTLEQLFGE